MQACKRVGRAKTEPLDPQEAGWQPSEMLDSKLHREMPLQCASGPKSGKAPYLDLLIRCYETRETSCAVDAWDPSPHPRPEIKQQSAFHRGAELLPSSRFHRKNQSVLGSIGTDPTDRRR